MSPSRPAEERATEGLQALLVQSNSSDDGDGVRADSVEDLSADARILAGR